MDKREVEKKVKALDKNIKRLNKQIVKVTKKYEKLLHVNNHKCRIRIRCCK